jgi:selenocysteine lyase/cysteine desulfurase
LSSSIDRRTVSLRRKLSGNTAANYLQNLRKRVLPLDPDLVIYYEPSNEMADDSRYHCAHPLRTALRLEPTVRVSFSVYNTDEEVDAMNEVLRSLYRFT